MEQKQVKLIGLRVQNNGIIQAAELTPDLLQKRLVLITGETGNGKSTLLNSAKIATAGTDAIKKSDALPDGFVAEALLRDGDIPIYIGVKTDTYTRGEHQGEQKLITYLYTKDANGKTIQPVIDGVQWTAAQYWKALTTELTHSLNDLFSENQTVHRKLIEKLFKPELDALHADKLVEEISALRKDRDTKRLVCQSNGAYMERFNADGWNEQTLSLLKKVDIDALRKKNTALEVEKAKKLDAPESAYQMACMKLDNERKDALQTLKDEGFALREQERLELEKIEAAYKADCESYIQALNAKASLDEAFSQIRSEVADFIGYQGEQRNEQGQVFVYGGNETQQAIIKGLDSIYASKKAAFAEIKEPVKGAVSAELQEKIAKKIAGYKLLFETPIQYPEKSKVDVSDIEREINNTNSEILSAETTNSVFDRYQMWQGWIAADEVYKSKVDELRKLYASIDTGVEGMKIVPRDTDSGKVEVWVMYDGSYNPEYFGNPQKEQRFMFDYSSFQRTIIGLMLQSARLNLKPRALRLAFIDDVAFTPRDIAVLTDISEKLDLRLITAWTHEANKQELLDGQVLVEGGEIFFNKQ